MSVRLRDRDYKDVNSVILVDRLLVVFRHIYQAVRLFSNILIDMAKKFPSYLFTLVYQLVSIFMHCCCICCIFFINRVPKLDEDDKGKLYRLKNKCARPFIQNNSTDEDFLRTLFIIAFPGEKLPDNNLESELWKSIGFQTNNPRIDFRGGGLMGLKQLIEFIEKFPTEYRRMKIMTMNNKFVFALNSVRTTFFLRRVFELDHFDIAASQAKKDLKQLRRMKNLCIFLQEDQNGNRILPDESNESNFNVLHQAILKITFKYWEECLYESPELTILHLSKAELNSRARFLKAIEKRIYSNVQEFLEALDATNPHSITKLDESEVIIYSK